MSHWHPLRFRYNRVLRTSLISTSRGRPPRGFCLAGGIMGLTMAHCSSVRSEGYFFLQRPSWSIFTHSSTEGICANYLIKLYFCQSIFPDSLLVIPASPLCKCGSALHGRLVLENLLRT